LTPVSELHEWYGDINSSQVAAISSALID
jgi:hypothetical protein